MNICVLVKNVEYIYAQTGSDKKSNYVGLNDIINIINPLDELAVEEALNIKESFPETNLTIITLGNHAAELTIRRCIAMGAAEGIHIIYDEYNKLDSWATARLLAGFLGKMQFDLILCGNKSIDKNNSLVGAYLAELINFPYLSNIVKINFSPDKKSIEVHRIVEKGNREIMECSIPILLAVEKGINSPRYPTLKGFLEAENTKVQKVSPEKIGFQKSCLDSLNLLEITKTSKSKPKQRDREKTKANLSAAEKRKLMMKGGNVKTKNSHNIIHGANEETVTEIVSLVSQR